MNSLIPFRFEKFRTEEAVYDSAVADILKRYWLTSYGMGQLFGAKKPSDFAVDMRRRHPNLPKGTPRSVRGLDGKIRGTLTYDLFEVFDYARYSILPLAKEYVARFWVCNRRGNCCGFWRNDRRS